MRARAITRVTTVALTAALAALGLAATPASAAAVLASTTTMSTAMTSDGSGLAVVVKVAAAATSAVAPTGTVVFSDDAKDALGSVKLPSCTLKTCAVAATLPTTSFGASVTKIVATYSGSSVLKPSAASAALIFKRCTAKSGCFGTLTNPSTTLAIGIPVNDTVFATLGGAALPCSAGAGSVVNLMSSGTGKVLSVALSHTGAAAATYEGLDAATGVAKAHTNYRCDVEPAAFPAFSPGTATFTKTSGDFATYGSTPAISAGPYAGSYAGLIPDCSYFFGHWNGTGSVCNNVATTTQSGSDQVYIAVAAASGLNHLAG